MTDKTTRDFNLDILDVSIDDIEDLPSFDCPLNGSYQLLVNASTIVFEGKDGKEDKDAVKFDYEITQVIEVAPGQVGQEPKEGDKFSELFGLANEEGIKYLKKAILPYAAHFGTNNLRELVTEKIANLVITATIKGRRAGRDAADPEKRYAQVSNVTLA